MNAAAWEKEPADLDPMEGPGRRLRLARQVKGLSVERVATQLHLSLPLVEALENDHFEHLPGSVFVRGYLRNYARLVGIDEDPILQAYYARQPTTEPAVPRVRANPQQEIRSNHVGVRLISWAILIGLVALLGFWVQSRFDWQPRQPVLDSAQVPGDAMPSGDPIARPEAISVLPPEPQPSRVDGGFRGEPGPVLPPAPIAAEPPVPMGEPEPPIPPRVSLEFTGATWVEVKDSKGKMILAGQFQKGDKRTLEGPPPFAMHVNKTRVQISVNGEPVAIPAGGGNNRVRFTLDPAKLPPPRP